MEDQPGAQPEGPRHAGRSAHARPRRRKPLSPFTVLGELLLVAGLAVFGFFGWQTVNTQIVVPGKQQALATEQSARWDAEVDPEKKWDGRIPVAEQAAPGEVFAVLYVPAMGENYAYRVAEGVDRASVLDRSDKGIGRYPGTQLPGAHGNLAMAAHRSGPWVTPFREVMDLHIGDPLYLETKDGWYTYRFRSLEYVLPDETDVLDPFPRVAGEPGKDRILTLTTCHPKQDGTAERAIAYAVFDDFRPRSDGPPKSLVEAEPQAVADALAADPTDPVHAGGPAGDPTVKGGV